MGDIVDMSRGQDGSAIMENVAATNAVEHQMRVCINFPFSILSRSREPLASVCDRVG